MYHSILVPLDGSAFGEHALPLALGVARRAGAALQLALVHTAPAAAFGEGSPAYVDASLEAELRRRDRAYLDGLAARLVASGAAVKPVLLEGEVADALCAHAAAAGADLVVMATHGRGPLGRFWLGSVADELVRRSPAPVLLVRPRPDAPDLGREPALGHVLVPLDGSPLAEQILEPATALGNLTGADYTLLRVIRPVPLAPTLSGAPSLGMEAEALLARVQAAHAQLRQEAQDYLDKVAERLRARGLRVQTRVVVEEHPAAAILREAAAPGTDLVALETHGRRGLARLFLGSVADKVLRGGSLPVLLRRPAAP